MTKLKFEFNALLLLHSYYPPIIPDALWRNNLSHFVTHDGICNISLWHSVINLPCPSLQYEICKKGLRHWIITFCSKIKYDSSSVSSYISTLALLMVNRLVRLLSWETTRNKVGHVFRWSRDKLKTFYCCFHEAHDYRNWQGCSFW